MLVSYLYNLLFLLGIFTLYFIGWYIIWKSILCNILIIREILGLDEPNNKYKKKFTLKYKN